LILQKGEKLLQQFPSLRKLSSTLYSTVPDHPGFLRYEKLEILPLT